MGRAGAILAAVMLASAAQAAPASPLPAQPDGLAFPSVAWEVAEPGGDVDVARLDAAIARAMAGEAAIGETRAVVVIHRGRLVREAYGAGFGVETKQVSWSMAKSITHALVGRAVQTGAIADITAPLTGVFDADDPRGQISWARWLQMTDGLAYAELDTPDITRNDVSRMMFGEGRRDVIGYARGLPAAHPPGEIWNYSTAGFHVLGRGLAVALGGGTALAAPDMAARIDALLFGPLGMEAVGEFDAAGTFLGGSLVWARARDFARFGYLYLRDGVWEGERLLPEGWVDFARTPNGATNYESYGAGFWLTNPADTADDAFRQSWIGAPLDGFSAQGHEGQITAIVPSRDLVVVRLGLMPNDRTYWRALYDWTQDVVLAFPDAGKE